MYHIYTQPMGEGMPGAGSSSPAEKPKAATFAEQQELLKSQEAAKEAKAAERTSNIEAAYNNQGLREELAGRQASLREQMKNAGPDALPGLQSSYNDTETLFRTLNAKAEELQRKLGVTSDQVQRREIR